MATTTNYGWVTPDDTDLVKDGAAAIRTLGTSVDTSFVDLLGGTTGQVLTKASGTNLDFTFATPSSGGMTLLSTTTLSGATTTISAISQSHNSLFIVGYGVTNATADGTTRIAPNGATGDAYYTLAQGAATPQSRSGAFIFVLGNASQTITRTNANNVFTCQINNYASATNYKSFQLYSGAAGAGGQEAWQIGGGAIFSNTAITSLTFSNSGGNLSTGTVLVYGVK